MLESLDQACQAHQSGCGQCMPEICFCGCQGAISFVLAVFLECIIERIHLHRVSQFGGGSMGDNIFDVLRIYFVLLIYGLQEPGLRYPAWSRDTIGFSIIVNTASLDYGINRVPIRLGFR